MTEIITAIERVNILKAVAVAIKNPTPRAVVEKYGIDNDDVTFIGLQIPKPPVTANKYIIQLASGYLVCVSFEDQPRGLCRHLSISSRDAGTIPSEAISWAIAQEFGFQEKQMTTMWAEEFMPGHLAVNFVEQVTSKDTIH